MSDRTSMIKSGKDKRMSNITTASPLTILIRNLSKSQVVGHEVQQDDLKSVLSSSDLKRVSVASLGKISFRSESSLVSSIPLLEQLEKQVQESFRENESLKRKLLELEEEERRLERFMASKKHLQHSLYHSLFGGKTEAPMDGGKLQAEIEADYQSDKKEEGVLFSLPAPAEIQSPLLSPTDHEAEIIMSATIPSTAQFVANGASEPTRVEHQAEIVAHEDDKQRAEQDVKSALSRRKSQKHRTPAISEAPNVDSIPEDVDDDAGDEKLVGSGRLAGKRTKTKLAQEVKVEEVSQQIVEAKVEVAEEVPASIEGKTEAKVETGVMSTAAIKRLPREKSESSGLRESGTYESNTVLIDLYATDASARSSGIFPSAFNLPAPPGASSMRETVTASDIQDTLGKTVSIEGMGDSPASTHALKIVLEEKLNDTCVEPIAMSTAEAEKSVPVRFKEVLMQNLDSKMKHVSSTNDFGDDSGSFMDSLAETYGSDYSEPADVRVPSQERLANVAQISQIDAMNAHPSRDDVMEQTQGTQEKSPQTPELQEKPKLELKMQNSPPSFLNIAPPLESPPAFLKQASNSDIAASVAVGTSTLKVEGQKPFSATVEQAPLSTPPSKLARTLSMVKRTQIMFDAKSKPKPKIPATIQQQQQAKPTEALALPVAAEKPKTGIKELQQAKIVSRISQFFEEKTATGPSPSGSKDQLTAAAPNSPGGAGDSLLKRSKTMMKTLPFSKPPSIAPKPGMSHTRQRTKSEVGRRESTTLDVVPDTPNVPTKQ